MRRGSSAGGPDELYNNLCSPSFHLRACFFKAIARLQLQREGYEWRGAGGGGAELVGEGGGGASEVKPILTNIKRQKEVAAAQNADMNK